MKFYVSSRFNKKKEVKALHEQIIAKGHEITRDWTSIALLKPYDADPVTSKVHAQQAIEAVQNSDVHILLSDEQATGMYTELGAALVSNIKTGKPKIFIIGEHNARSIFYFHPSVERVKTIEEVFALLRL